jgi:hypothetical protein
MDITAVKQLLVVVKGKYKMKAINTGPLQLWKSIKHARNVRPTRKCEKSLIFHLDLQN